MDTSAQGENKSYLNATGNIDVPYVTLPERLKYFSTSKRDEEAIVFVDSKYKRVTVTFGEIYEKSERFAKCLLRMGIGKGDIVGISHEMTPVWLVATMAVQMTGAAPLHFFFDGLTGQFAKEILKKSERCKMIIMNPGLDDNHWKYMNDCIASNIDCHGNVKSDVISSLQKVILTQNRDGFSLTYDKIMSETLNDNSYLPSLDPEDIAAIFLSSGSTGPPKLIPHTHHSMLISSFRGSLTDEGLDKDILYNDRAFSWLGGYPLSLFYSGGKRIICTDQNSDGDVNKRILDTICIEKCTTAVLMPPLISTLLQDKERKWFVNTVCTMALPIAARNAKLTGKYCKKFMNAYACTESGLLATNIVFDQNDFVKFDVGSPVSGVEIKVMNLDGSLTTIGNYGEVYIRSKGLTPGYLDNVKGFKDKLSPTGWFQTGDIGLVTSHKHLILSGRIADALVINSVYYPSEFIENIVQDHPEVQQCIALPIEDRNMSNVFCVALVLKDCSNASENDFRDFVEGNENLQEKILATKGCILPRYYLILDSFPKLTSGKIARSQIKELCLERLRNGGH